MQINRSKYGTSEPVTGTKNGTSDFQMMARGIKNGTCNGLFRNSEVPNMDHTYSYHPIHKKQSTRGLIMSFRIPVSRPPAPARSGKPDDLTHFGLLNYAGCDYEAPPKFIHTLSSSGTPVIYPSIRQVPGWRGLQPGCNRQWHFMIDAKKSSETRVFTGF